MTVLFSALGVVPTHNFMVTAKIVFKTESTEHDTYRLYCNSSVSNANGNDAAAVLYDINYVKYTYLHHLMAYR
jgi:hypothetical protein